MITQGETAPDFTLPRDGGGNLTLSALRPGKVVLYFYPKDDTPGCALEAQDFTAQPFAAAWGEGDRDVQRDSIKSHDRFCKKHGLGITLVWMRRAIPVKITGFGSRKACMAKPIWGSSAPRF